jgi:hypothetical protein
VFKKLIDAYRAHKDIKKLEAHPIYGAVLMLLRERLNDTSQGIGKHWSEEAKLRMISGILKDIDQRLNQPNPVQAVRMRLVELTLMTAGFEVLTTKKPFPFQGISGKLKEHIPLLAKSDPELGKFIYSVDGKITDVNEQWDACLAGYWMLHLYMSAFNITRISLNDYHIDQKKDWFKACYLSFCIWQEQKYRTDLGLPTVIPGTAPEMRAIAHNSWIDRAEEGHTELRLVWEKSWQVAFNEPSPFEGIAIFI